MNNGEQGPMQPQNAGTNPRGGEKLQVESSTNPEQKPNRGGFAWGKLGVLGLIIATVGILGFIGQNTLFRGAIFDFDKIAYYPQNSFEFFSKDNVEGFSYYYTFEENKTTTPFGEDLVFNTVNTVDDAYFGGLMKKWFEEKSLGGYEGDDSLAQATELMKGAFQGSEEMSFGGIFGNIDAEILGVDYAGTTYPVIVASSRSGKLKQFFNKYTDGQFEYESFDLPQIASAEIYDRMAQNNEGRVEIATSDGVPLLDAAVYKADGSDISSTDPSNPAIVQYTNVKALADEESFHFNWDASEVESSLVAGESAVAMIEVSGMPFEKDSLGTIRPEPFVYQGETIEGPFVMTFQDMNEIYNTFLVGSGEPDTLIYDMNVYMRVVLKEVSLTNSVLAQSETFVFDPQAMQFEAILSGPIIGLQAYSPGAPEDPLNTLPFEDYVKIEYDPQNTTEDLVDLKWELKFGDTETITKTEVWIANELDGEGAISPLNSWKSVSKGSFIDKVSLDAGALAVFLAQPTIFPADEPKPEDFTTFIQIVVEQNGYELKSNIIALGFVKAEASEEVVKQFTNGGIIEDKLSFFAFNQMIDFSDEAAVNEAVAMQDGDTIVYNPTTENEDGIHFAWDTASDMLDSAYMAHIQIFEDTDFTKEPVVDYTEFKSAGEISSWISTGQLMQAFNEAIAEGKVDSTFLNGPMVYRIVLSKDAADGTTSLASQNHLSLNFQTGGESVAEAYTEAAADEFHLFIKNSQDEDLFNDELNIVAFDPEDAATEVLKFSWEVPSVITDKYAYDITAKFNDGEEVFLQGHFVGESSSLSSPAVELSGAEIQRYLIENKLDGDTSYPYESSIPLEIRIDLIPIGEFDEVPVYTSVNSYQVQFDALTGGDVFDETFEAQELVWCTEGTNGDELILNFAEDVNIESATNKNSYTLMHGDVELLISQVILVDSKTVSISHTGGTVTDDFHVYVQGVFNEALTKEVNAKDIYVVKKECEKEVITPSVQIETRKSCLKDSQFCFVQYGDYLFIGEGKVITEAITFSTINQNKATNTVVAHEEVKKFADDLENLAETEELAQEGFGVLTYFYAFDNAGDAESLSYMPTGMDVDHFRILGFLPDLPDKKFRIFSSLPDFEQLNPESATHITKEFLLNELKIMVNATGIPELLESIISIDRIKEVLHDYTHIQVLENMNYDVLLDAWLLIADNGSEGTETIEEFLTPDLTPPIEDPADPEVTIPDTNGSGDTEPVVDPVVEPTDPVVNNGGGGGPTGGGGGGTPNKPTVDAGDDSQTGGGFSGPDINSVGTDGGNGGGRGFSLKCLRPAREATLFNDIEGIEGEAAIKFFAKLTAKSEPLFVGKADEEAGSGRLFEPDEPLTRAEALKILTICLASDVINNHAGFHDINGHWAEDIIKRGANQGIVSGYLDGRFGPDDAVLRGQILKMILEYKGDELLSHEAVYRDVSAADWESQYVVTAYKKGYLGGISSFDQDNFEPNKPITREEMAQLLRNLYEIMSIAS